MYVEVNFFQKYELKFSNLKVKSHFQRIFFCFFPSKIKIFYLKKLMQFLHAIFHFYMKERKC